MSVNADVGSSFREMKGKNEASRLPDPTLSSVDGGASSQAASSGEVIYITFIIPRCVSTCETSDVLVYAMANFNHVFLAAQ